MDSIGFITVAAGLIAYSLISGRLSQSIVTPPMLFAGFGFAIGSGGLGIFEFGFGQESVHLIAEITLILVLFTDAARIHLRDVRQNHNIPIRLLVIGMPLVIAFGTAVGVALPLGLPIWSAAVLAAILAPTDAALGQSVLINQSVPSRIRQTLNIESGLNDGIALPVVLILASLAGVGMADNSDTNWFIFTLKQLTLGPAVGIAVGSLAILVDRAVKSKYMAPTAEGFAILAIAFLAFAGAEWIGGNGFIAAFVAGMVFGNSARHRCKCLFDFAESEGQFLTLVTFLFFGAVILPEILPHISLAAVIYSILSLTAVRMIPVALSLIGSGLAPQTNLLLGWFGPRGLASILFALFILEEIEVAGAELILTITMTTVALSIVAHGVTAAPFAQLYARSAASKGEWVENALVTELPYRLFHRIVKSLSKD